MQVLQMGHHPWVDQGIHLEAVETRISILILKERRVVTGGEIINVRLQYSTGWLLANTVGGIMIVLLLERRRADEILEGSQYTMNPHP